jgi:hypothetical protein
MTIKFQKKSIQDAIHSFVSPFCVSGHPVFFTVSLQAIVDNELDLEEEELNWPVSTEEEVEELVLEAFKEHSYSVEVEVNEFESDDVIDWDITIDAKFDGSLSDAN